MVERAAVSGQTLRSGVRAARTAPGSSRCAEPAGHRCPAALTCRRGTRARPLRRAPPSPRTAAACRGTRRAVGTPASTRRRSASPRPSSARFAIALGNAPTPGSTSPSARTRSSGRELTSARAPTCSSAFCDRAAVAHPVVDDGDQRRAGAHVSVPLVLGTPRLGGIDRGRRAQRPGQRLERRLDHVVGVAAGLDRRWSVILALAASARKNSSASSWSKLPIAPGGSVGLEHEQAAPGDVDRARRAGLVHGDGRVPVADDPTPIAERAVERLPEADPDVLDRVVGAGLQVAGGLERRGRAGRGARARSSMWSRNPTPLFRSPAPVPSSASPSRMLGLTGGAVDLRAAGHVSHPGPDCPRMRASIDRAWSSKPSARATGAAARASAAGSAIRTSEKRAREVRRRESGGEARRAGGRQDVVGARDVVAERGPAPRADEQAARPGDPRRERFGRHADELEMLGRERLGQRERPLGPSKPRRRRTTAPMSGAPASSAASRSSSVRRAETADDERPRAVLGLGEQVERQRLGVGVRRSAITSRSLGPAKPSIPTRPGHLALGLLDVQVAGADDHVDRPGSTRSRRRARRSPGRRPSGRRSSAPVSRQAREDRRVDLAVAAGRRAHDDLAARRPRGP